MDVDSYSRHLASYGFRLQRLNWPSQRAVSLEGTPQLKAGYNFITACLQGIRLFANDPRKCLVEFGPLTHCYTGYQLHTYGKEDVIIDQDINVIENPSFFVRHLARDAVQAALRSSGAIPSVTTSYVCT
jgi:hypothetical protein